MVASVLHLDEGARMLVEAFDHEMRGLARRHDVADDGLVARRDAERARHGRIGPCLGAHLLDIADHAIDLVHGAEALRLDLSGAARDDNGCVWLFAPDAADRLARLARRLGGDGASVDDNEIAASCAFRRTLDSFKLGDIEPAAEGDDLDAHRRAIDARRSVTAGDAAKSDGASVPSHSNSTGPVIST